MTRIADYVVFGVCVLSLPLVIGMDIGQDQARQQLATVCAPQPGATLASTYQDKSGVLCLYVETPRPEYGRAVRKQKATRA
jgi:hypothetical protein